MPNIFGLTTRLGLAYYREMSEHLRLRFRVVPNFTDAQVLRANFMQHQPSVGKSIYSWKVFWCNLWLRIPEVCIRQRSNY